MGRERGAIDCRREALSCRSPGYPEPQGPQVAVRGARPLDALTVPPAARAPVLSRPAAAPCPSSGSRRGALPPRCRRALRLRTALPSRAALSIARNPPGKAPSSGTRAGKVGKSGRAPGARGSARFLATGWRSADPGSVADLALRS